MNHEQAQALLPWHVAATLGAADAHAVAGHVADCERCSADIRLFTGVQEVSAHPQAGEPVYRPQLLDSVMAQLDSVPQDEALAPPAGTVQRMDSQQSLTRWLSGRFRALAEQLDWAMTPVAAKWVMVTQCALLVGVLGLYAANDTDQVEQEFVTVAGPTVAAGGADFVIAFKPGIAEADMRELLLSSNASLVAGPNAVGLYRIALPNHVDRSKVESELRVSDWIIYLETVDDR